MKFWNSYKIAVIRNCTGAAPDENTIGHWGNVLFSNLILYLLPLSIIAILPGIAFSFMTGYIVMGILDCIILFALIALTLYPRFSVDFRKHLLIGICYFASGALLIIIGIQGPGLIYLMITTVIYVLIFPGKNAFLPSWLNTVIISIISGMILFADFKWEYQDTTEPGLWIAVSSNMIFLSFAISAFVPKIFLGIQNAINNQIKLKDELQKNEKSLSAALNKLEAKNREIAEFAVIASHDLKEPLRTVRTMSELLQKKYAEKIEARGVTMLNLIISSAKRGIKLTEDLLEYARLDQASGGFSLVDTDSLVKEVVQQLKSPAAAAEFTVYFDSLPKVYARENALHRLFYNLIGNGIKYSRPDVKPEIRISASDAESFTQFVISDNGIGIAEEHFQEIFRIFKRLHSRDEFEGTGVGLAACKKIVEQHDGKIWVESQTGSGSIFYFTLAKQHENGNE